jgi:hypothetical protein
MTKQEIEKIKEIVGNSSWDLRKNILEYVRGLTPTEETKPEPRMKRTGAQNDAIHVYCELVSTALNDAGLGVQKALAHAMEIDWTPQRVKELIWRKSQIQLLGKESTTELDKLGEIELIYEHINRWLASLGVEHIPFPAEEKKNNIKLNAITNLNKPDYPEYDGPPTI